MSDQSNQLNFFSLRVLNIMSFLLFLLYYPMKENLLSSLFLTQYFAHQWIFFEFLSTGGVVLFFADNKLSNLCAQRQKKYTWVKYILPDMLERSHFFLEVSLFFQLMCFSVVNMISKGSSFTKQNCSSSQDKWTLVWVQYSTLYLTKFPKLLKIIHILSRVSRWYAGSVHCVYLHHNSVLLCVMDLYTWK